MSFTREQNIAGGKKSKRTGGIISKEIRTQLETCIDIPKINSMLDELEPKDFIKAQIEILKLIVPQLQRIDLTANLTGSITLDQFRVMDRETQIKTLLETNGDIRGNF